MGNQTLDEHLGYLRDSVRLQRFRAAVDKVVSPGARVVDLGCGSGILGMLCLRAGASHVDAIDASAAIELARQAYERQGWGPFVHFIHDSSFRVELEERADVVICDHVGYFGIDYGLIETLTDARRRFLKPGGRVVPQRLQLQLALAQSEAGHKLAQAWNEPDVPPDFRWVRSLGVNAKYPVNLRREDILSTPVDLAAIDLGTESPEFFSWALELEVTHSGVAHGLAGWFDCELVDGIFMSNSPFSAEPIRRPQAFFPLDEAWVVEQGDRLNVALQARPQDHLYAWEVKHLRTGRSVRLSTWLGDLLNADRIRKTRPDAKPTLTRTARARQTVLACCDGTRTVREILAVVTTQHSSLFPSPGEAERFVLSVLSANT